MGKYYIAFDAGTQSIKVAMYSLEMECVAEAVNPTFFNYPKPGWVEMDVDKYFEGLKAGLKSLAEQATAKGIDLNDIRAIFGDGIICGITGIDADGNSITPYINYLDSRTTEDVAELTAADYEIFRKESGNNPNVMFPAMFARWFLKNNKAFQERGAKFVHNCPYLLMKLAGLKAEDAFIDWGAMSGWGLGYKIMEKEWSDEQLEILGIDKKYMPKIIKPWDIVGHLTEENAAETGLPAGIPICAGAGDTMESMIGCGLTGANQAADVAGTASMFCVATDGIIPELSKPGTGLIFNSGTLENTYFYWGIVRAGGLSLRWYRDNICDKVDDGPYYDELSKRAADIPVGSNGVLFIPYLTGGNADCPDASGCFVNMTMDTNQATLWRAVLESIAYEYMDMVNLYRGGGIPLETFTITEGGSRSDLWNQIKSDMIGAEVTTLKKAGGAITTNVAVAAYAAGDLEDLGKAVRDTLEVQKIYKPNRENTEYYRSIYDMRKKLVQDDMKTAFANLAKIRF